MKYFLSLIVLTLLPFLSAFSQDKDHSDFICGTQVSQRDIIKTDEMIKHAKLSMFRKSEEIIPLAITVHIIRRSNGSGGISPQVVQDAIDRANEFYSKANLSFFIFGEVNFIDEDEFYEYDFSQESDLVTGRNVANTINIYFAEVVKLDDTQLCGYAYFPAANRDVVLMRNSCTVSGTTLEHELGHYFALYHTHGKSNFGTTDELVDGSNCETAGDDLCDTVADPNLFGKVNSNCEYTENEKDANGDAFMPDPSNIMSYSIDQCQDKFSPQQYERMNMVYQQSRNYLITRPYAANFSVDVQSICSGQQIKFEDRSVGATQWFWEFEGGQPATSTEQSPLVTYETAGEFSVRLTITSEGNETDVLNRNSFINVREFTPAEISEFEDNFATQFDYEIINTDNGLTWQYIQVSQSGTSRSKFMNFYSYENVGAQDLLVLPALNTAGGKIYELNFKYAYTYYLEGDLLFSDKMEVVYRETCTQEWEILWSKSGDDLITANPRANSFVPNSSEWEDVTLSFDVDFDVDEIEIAFRSTNGYGNNFYLDSYSIDQIKFGIDELEISNLKCFGEENGAVQVVASGNDLTYILNDDISNNTGLFEGLAAGSYSIKISNDFYVQQTSFEITQPEELSVDVDLTNPLCADDANGKISLTIGGGIAPYQISIDNGSFGTQTNFENLAEGSYNFLVKDNNGCEYQTNVQITSPNELFVDLLLTNPTCINSNDGLISVNITGGTQPYLLSLNGGDFSQQTDIESLAVGVYSLVIKDNNNCEIVTQSELSAQFDDPVKPFIQFDADRGSVFIENNNYSIIRWYFEGILIDATNRPSLAINTSGSYQVEVGYSENCINISDITMISNIAEASSLKVSIYPNPTSDVLNLRLEGINISDIDLIEVLDLSGRSLTSISKTDRPFISVGSLSSGAYMLRVVTAEKVYLQKFIKQ